MNTKYFILFWLFGKATVVNVEGRKEFAERKEDIGQKDLRNKENIRSVKIS